MNAPLPTNKPLVATLGGVQRIPPPVWLMRQAGRYLPEYRELRGRARDFLTFCYTPELACEATLQPVRRFGMDGAVVFSDILVIPDALGQPVSFVPGKGPVLEPVRGADGLGRLSAARLAEHLTPVYETLRQAARALPRRTALIGFAGAPWTLAAYMVEGGSSRDFARVKSWAFAEPESFARLIDLLTEAVAAHLEAQAEAGAEVIQIFDSWAGVLPEDAFRRWCITPARRIVARLRESRPGLPVIAFPNRAGLLYEAYAQETGVDAVSIDATVPPAWAAARLQPHCAVQGNLDPVRLLAGGEALGADIDRILGALAAGPFVFNLGHGVLPETPPAHVAALVERVRGWTP